jgi:Arc/MetJ-type ribon-helix-helix transcriptional regulator
MPRITVTLDDEHVKLIEEHVGDDAEYASKSGAVRGFIDRYEQCMQQLTAKEARIQELEQEVEQLREEKRKLLRDREEHGELVRYVEDELSYREAPLSKRVRWWLFGKPTD